MSREPPTRPDDASPGDATGRRDGDIPAIPDAERADFGPEDVHVPPPDQPPNENAPASEKAGLIFERS